MSKLSAKLKETVENHYEGDLERLLSAAKECSRELYKLQGKLEDKRLAIPQPHNLKDYWLESSVEELKVLSEGLLESSDEQNLVDVVQRSVLLKRKGEIYGVPYSLKVKDAVPALAGGSLARIVGRYLPAPYGLGFTVAGVAVAEGREIWHRRVKNPFQQLGDMLSKKVEKYEKSRYQDRE